jgi:hypothetical protein
LDYLINCASDEGYQFDDREVRDETLVFFIGEHSA